MLYILKNDVERLKEIRWNSGMIIDFHSHILPGIDDGSRDVDTSVEMLKMCTSQRIGTMIATPHFYGERDEVKTFLARRDDAYHKLEQSLMPGMPEIRLGAEVAFFRGISRAEHLELLTMEQSSVLLLEMPFAPWSQSEMEEVEWLIHHTKFQVMLAHLERYLEIRENKSKIEQLLELPLTVQVNAGSLLDWRTRRGAIRLLKKSQTCVLGSDCHGVHHRVPNLMEGRTMLEKKMKSSFLEQIDRDGCRLIGKKEEESR
jgi:protein-tyrosine phosphatase